MPWDFRFSDPFQHLSVHLPRSIMDFHPDGPAASVLHAFPASSLLARSLIMLSKLIIFERSRYGVVEEVRLRDSLVSLVAGGLAAGSENPARAPNTAARRTFARAQSAIERRLADPDLCPADIAGEAGISLQSLRRLFHHIVSRRLQRAYHLLISASAGHRSVTEIAYHWGFKDLGHFSRAFRRKFSQSPGDVHAQGS